MEGNNGVSGGGMLRMPASMGSGILPRGLEMTLAGDGEHHHTATAAMHPLLVPFPTAAPQRHQQLLSHGYAACPSGSTATKGKGTKQLPSTPAPPTAASATFCEDFEPAFGGAADDHAEGRRFPPSVRGELADPSPSPWHRMKWTDSMVRLLIMIVYCVGDDVIAGNADQQGAGEQHQQAPPNSGSGKGRKVTMSSASASASASGGGSLLQKKGKWKSVSRAMMEKGFYVSPQQCEDKFNDLNKRYKRVNELLGKGTACRVVENHALLDSMDHLPPKAKEEARKLLNSKHLFFREMCAYHTSINGACVSGGDATCAPRALTPHSSESHSQSQSQSQSQSHQQQQQEHCFHHPSHSSSMISIDLHGPTKPFSAARERPSIGNMLGGVHEEDREDRAKDHNSHHDRNNIDDNNDTGDDDDDEEVEEEDEEEEEEDVYDDDEDEQEDVAGNKRKQYRHHRKIHEEYTESKEEGTEEEESSWKLLQARRSCSTRTLLPMKTISSLSASPPLALSLSSSPVPTAVEQPRSDLMASCIGGVQQQRQWLKRKTAELEEQRVGYQCQAFELERQRFKWLRFSTNKEREMEKMKLRNERLCLENDRTLLLLRQKEQELITDANATPHNSNNATVSSDPIPLQVAAGSDRPQPAAY